MIAAAAHAGQTLAAIREWPAPVINCDVCGFAHVWPLPSDAQLEELYRTRYYTELKPDYLRNAEEDAAWWQLVYSERYALLEQHTEGRRVVDVGSGPGYFLAAGKQRGWETIGIEPSQVAREYSVAKFNIDVINARFDAQTLATRGQWPDVVHLGEVLEHIPDPAQLLGHVRRVLSPSGLVCVMVPNDFSLLQAAVVRVLKMEPWWVAPPAHLNYFNLKSLRHLLHRCGFDFVEATATFPMELFLLMGVEYVGSDTLGRHVHRMRKSLELNLEAAALGGMKRSIYRAMARFGIGRDLVVVARRRA